MNSGTLPGRPMTYHLHTDSEGKTVVDLHRSFPGYKHFWEADGATKAKLVREDWPWLMEIRGRNGLVHPFGGELLCAVSYRSRTGRRLRQIGSRSQFGRSHAALIGTVLTVEHE